MIEGDNWPIATERVKWNPEYQKKHGIQTNAAQICRKACIDRIQRLVRRIYRTLALTGYARVDLRMDAEGKSVLPRRRTPTRSWRKARTSRNRQNDRD